MEIIPLQSLPSQRVSVVVGGQQCQFSVYQKAGRLYFDLSVNGESVCNTRLIRNGVFMLRQQYFGVIGDFMVIDQTGQSDPEYTGLGARWVLVYVNEVQ